MRFAVKLAEALTGLVEDQTTVDYHDAGNTPNHKDTDTNVASTSSLAHDLIQVLNPFPQNSFGGSFDYIAPEQTAAVQPFDENMVEYFYTIMALYEPRIAKMWRPAVQKYKRFEAECRRLVTEQRKRSELARKLDRITFAEIVNGVEQIARILKRTSAPGLERVRAAFLDFAAYVRRVRPYIEHFLAETGLSGVT